MNNRMNHEPKGSARHSVRAVIAALNVREYHFDSMSGAHGSDAPYPSPVYPIFLPFITCTPLIT